VHVPGPGRHAECSHRSNHRTCSGGTQMTCLHSCLGKCSTSCAWHRGGLPSLMSEAEPGRPGRCCHQTVTVAPSNLSLKVLHPPLAHVASSAVKSLLEICACMVVLPARKWLWLGLIHQLSAQGSCRWGHLAEVVAVCRGVGEHIPAGRESICREYSIAASPSGAGFEQQDLSQI
jgi:hypothetical protein